MSMLIKLELKIIILLIIFLFALNISSISPSLSQAKIFNYYTNTWGSIENMTIEYKNDEEGIITYLDLYDSERQALISTYKKYPEDFNISKVKIKFFSMHDINFNCGEFYAKFCKINGTEYIGISNIENIESDKYIKRSSFDYTLTINLEDSNEERNVIFRFNKQYLNIGEFLTCFHDLSIYNTFNDIPLFYEYTYSKNKTKVFRIELRTKDNNLYIVY